MESQSLNSITCSKSFTLSSLLPAFSILLIYPVKYSSELTQRYSSYIVLDNKLLPCECSFITPLFIVAPTGKQPKYPSHSTWAGKLVHPYRELLLSKERDKLPTHAATRVDLKGIMLSGKTKVSLKRSRTIRPHVYNILQRTKF